MAWEPCGYCNSPYCAALTGESVCYTDDRLLPQNFDAISFGGYQVRRKQNEVGGYDYLAQVVTFYPKGELPVLQPNDKMIDGEKWQFI